MFFSFCYWDLTDQGTEKLQRFLKAPKYISSYNTAYYVKQWDTMLPRTGSICCTICLMLSNEKSAFRQCWANSRANTSLPYSWHIRVMEEKNRCRFYSKLTPGLHLLSGIELTLKDWQVTQQGSEWTRLCSTITYQVYQAGSLHTATKLVKFPH